MVLIALAAEYAAPTELERFKKYCSHSGRKRRGSGLFGFWRRFSFRLRSEAVV
jgi:hypothetical protein